ncbi:conjugal transfer protein TraF [Isoalcanivorax pacificus]|uniref:conjugal transfer protein TraF n=1 Tax=Isoalcanivorax pacificus TaxID=1306787 RepID=UPI0009E4BB80|nr:conjugal transfer protein TraF [Isoalcanivorax pacificus]
MFTRSLVAVAIATASVSAAALPGAAGKGPNVTYGYSGHGVNLHSLSNNPAQGFYVMPEEDRFRMGVAGSISVGYEMGEVDNFLDRLDDILDDLERDDIGVAEGITLANEMNDVLVQMGRDGYARINTGLQAPLTPIAFRTSLGTFSVSIEADAEVKASVLDDAVVYDAVNQELRTRSSLYLKSATFAQVGVGWAKELWKDEGQSLVGGARLNIINGAFSKQVINLKAAATNPDDDDIGDIISDQYDTNEKKSTNISIDLGAIYRINNWSAGLTLKNINEPEFDYGAVGQNCASLPGGSQEYANCMAADYFAQNGRISASEKWVMASQATVDGSYSFNNGRGMVGFSYDLTDVNTPTGDLQQMLSLMTAYQSPKIWLPGVRAGYHTNQKGSQLSSVSVGLTWFNRLTFDVLMGLEDTEIDGDKLPRTAAVSLGWQSRF